MSRIIRLTLAVVVLSAVLPALPVMAVTSPPPVLPPPLDKCEGGYQASGAVYAICMPATWNGDLVVFAHGYVAPSEPWSKFVEQLTLPDGTTLPGLVNNLGFAFATTSYSANGLAVLPGVQDIKDLVDIFKAKNSGTHHVYLTGASEGGLVTTLAVERFPTVFSGGLATCGPIGDFRKQINYWGDFRVVFDYFFPGVLPPTPVSIPPQVMTGWTTTFVPAISNAVTTKPHATDQLLQVTQAAFDPANPATKKDTVLGLLWYNAFATNDGKIKLGGQPYNNKNPFRWYLGSDNDFRLNRLVQRFTADSATAPAISAHQTSGKLRVPLVTLHTTGDPIVPYWHEPLYTVKSLANGSGLLHSNIPILRYGHCNFESSEVLVGFALLVLKVTGRELIGAQMALPDFGAQAEFLRLAKEHGALR
jgi:pimeloyl-ACP methyl ester carboxylesterase